MGLKPFQKDVFWRLDNCTPELVKTGNYKNVVFIVCGVCVCARAALWVPCHRKGKLGDSRTPLFHGIERFAKRAPLKHVRIKMMMTI
eukprot:6467710-Amphidinium_carterae.1